MSSCDPIPDSRSPTIEASSPCPMDLDDMDTSMTLSRAIGARRTVVPTDAAKISLVQMRDEIEELLGDPWHKDFVNTSKTLMRLGNKKPRLVEPHRQKLRDIIANNAHVAKLYNKYAMKHAESEKRLTFRLPIFADLEQEGGDQEDEKQDEAEGGAKQDVTDNQVKSFNLALQTTYIAEAQSVGLQESLPEIGLQSTYSKQGEGGVLAPEQTEQALDKQMEVTQANNTDNNQRSIENDPKQHRAGEDIDMTGLDVLNRAEAPSVQKRHVHFAPEATLSQQQLSTAVKLTKVDGTVVRPTPKKNKTKAVKIPAHPIQPFHPGLTRDQVTPVTNPEAFPIERIQVVQAQYYSSARIVNVLTHRNPSGEVVRATADMQDGPVNHFAIHDARIITALGLRDGDGDKITVQKDEFKMHETFTITVLPNQRVRNLNNFVVGELRLARHAYLHWLDYRGSADPAFPPFIREARKIAAQLGRRAHDVWREIDSYWQLEQGNGGKQYRNNRLKYLGEDVSYDMDIEKKEGMPSMWA